MTVIVSNNRDEVSICAQLFGTAGTDSICEDQMKLFDERSEFADALF
jgi:hypothetical protein